MKVLFPEEGESWSSFNLRLQNATGEVIVVISGAHDADLVHHEEECRDCLRIIEQRKQEVKLATHNIPLKLMAQSRGISVIVKAKDLKHVLKNHSQYEEALREFLPQVWRQHLRTRLQTMGLLSLPKLRIVTLIGISVVLFFFVVFKLLPSSEIVINPKEDTLIQTSNIFLVLSGSAITNLPERVRTMELIPVRARVDRTITFDKISKQFTGKSAYFDMKIVNNSEEEYRLRAGSRLSNQAGMVFTVEDPIVVGAKSEIVTKAQAADEDLYGEVIGGRGNVPAGLRWDFIGLLPEEKQLVYGENVQEGRGGITSERLVLHEKDLDIARKQLEQELLAEANQLIDEDIQLRNIKEPDKVITRLYYDELTKISYTGFVMPTKFLGETVQTVPVQGAVIYEVYVYDSKYILDILSEELKSHVEEGKRLIAESMTIDRLVTHVIDYADDLSWIKLTVDLSGTQQSVLDPLTPTGAAFAKSVRTIALGLTKEDAITVIRNMPEVEKVTISLWPFWTKTLSDIPSHITITIVQ